MASLVAAMSRASTSGVRRAKAFLEPSGLCPSLVHIPSAIVFLASNIPDEGVDLDGVHIVELLKRLLDLPLVRLDVHDEDESVVLFNLLHGALGVERVDDDLAGIEAGLRWDRLAGVFGRARESEGLWEVERRALADLVDLVRVDLLK
jgi:hypothetical protein